jgi:hypothetical protein
MVDAAPPQASDDHVRVRRGMTTAFVSVDVTGGATGGALRAAAARALCVPGDAAALRLVRDAGRVPLSDAEPLNAQGIAVDDLILAVCTAGSGESEPLEPVAALGRDGDG